MFPFQRNKDNVSDVIIDFITTITKRLSTLIDFHQSCSQNKYNIIDVNSFRLGVYNLVIIRGVCWKSTTPAGLTVAN